MVEEEWGLICGDISPFRLFCDISIESWQMSGNRSVETWNYLIEKPLLAAHGFIIIFSLEAVFLINQLPNVGTIITWKRFDIKINIEILAFIIFFVFHMPYPFVRSCLSLVSPSLLLLSIRIFRPNFISPHPILGNFFFIASTNCTAFWFADFGKVGEFTLRVYV